MPYALHSANIESYRITKGVIRRLGGTPDMGHRERAAGHRNGRNE
jgi:hypothetical protein